VKYRFVLSLLLVSVTLCLAACASSPAKSENGLVRIVASTNVYGDIARRVGGDLVDVVSIVSDSARDPHDYSAEAHDRLTVSQADIVIKNGGGYDSFLDPVVSTARKDVVVLNAVDFSEDKNDAQGNRFNEHVWYDVATVQRITSALVDALGDRSPSGSATFHANGESFAADLKGLRDSEAALAAAHSGRSVAITEPVPLYMLEASGLVNATPAAFSDAIEQNTDVPPGILAQTLDLFAKRSVGALFYNEQTGGPQAEAVVAAANANGIPVVPIAETLPPGENYIGWMRKNLGAISGALAG
jgi:zinc/manganese transport system substrate-binding protein